MITFIAHFLNGLQRTPRSSRKLGDFFFQLCTVKKRLWQQEVPRNSRMQQTLHFAVCRLSGALDLKKQPSVDPTTMKDQTLKVVGLSPGREVMSRQRLPYFIGISGQTVNAAGLSMHLVVIPPGGRAEPHIHIGYETGIYVLEGRVCTRWGAELEHEVISEAGDFLFVPPGVPHEAINLSATEPARAVVARKDPAEQDKVVPFVPKSNA